jgi:hypothetical protein
MQIPLGLQAAPRHTQLGEEPHAPGRSTHVGVVEQEDGAPRQQTG